MIWRWERKTNDAVGQFRRVLSLQPTYASAHYGPVPVAALDGAIVSMWLQRLAWNYGASDHECVSEPVAGKKTNITQKDTYNSDLFILKLESEELLSLQVAI